MCDKLDSKNSRLNGSFPLPPDEASICFSLRLHLNWDYLSIFTRSVHVLISSLWKINDGNSPLGGGGYPC